MRDARGVFLVSSTSPHIRLGGAQTTDLHYRLSQKIGKEAAAARLQALSARGPPPDGRALPENVRRAAGALCVELSTFLDGALAVLYTAPKPPRGSRSSSAGGSGAGS